MLDFLKNNSDKHPVAEIFDGLSAHLEFLSELGCAGMECSDKSLELIDAWGVAGTIGGKFRPGLTNHFNKCRDCSLSKERRQIVRADGNPKARLVIVGGVAAPDDVRAGKPYSGKVGDLLNKMIAAMNLTRDQIYITRAVKCCLPLNQKPTMADVNTCRGYLEKELKMLQPDVIIAFGETAVMSLLETSVPVARLRGRFHNYRGIQVMPTFSPEYLIENADAKRYVWEDLKQVIGEMGKITKRK